MSDAHRGFKAAVSTVLCVTSQRRRVHFKRNVLAHAGKSGRRIISAFIAAAFAQETAEAASLQWRAVTDQIRPKVPKLAAVMDEAEADALAYMTFPTVPRNRVHIPISKKATRIVVKRPHPCYIIAMQHKWTPYSGRPGASKKMNYFLWTEAMSVGVPALDADHKCLVRIINVLRELDRDEEGKATVETVLDSLKLYGRTHFKREERVMDAVRFPGGAFHRAEHQNFVRHIEFLRSKFSSGQLEPTRELYDYLTGWLRHHILIQDMAYKPYVSNAPNAESIAREAAPPLPNIVDSLPIESLSA